MAKAKKEKADNTEQPEQPSEGTSEPAEAKVCMAGEDETVDEVDLRPRGPNPELQEDYEELRPFCINGLAARILNAAIKLDKIQIELRKTKEESARAWFALHDKELEGYRARPSPISGNNQEDRRNKTREYLHEDLANCMEIDIEVQTLQALAERQAMRLTTIGLLLNAINAARNFPEMK